MRAFLRGILIFSLFTVAAGGVLSWPVQLFLEAGGKFDRAWVPPEPLPEELAKASAMLLGAGLLSVILLLFGLSWTVLRAWKPFAIALGATVAINGALVAFAFLQVGPDWVPALLLATFPLGLLAILYSIFLSLRNNLLLITFLRLVGATVLAVAISILFPFLVIAAGIYLQRKRGLSFREVWSESPHMYNFLIVNIYPIFFQILPGLNYVVQKGKEEKKQARKLPPSVFQSQLDLSRLKVGDVILTGSDSWNEGVPIQASNILSASEDERFWYHAAIYAGNGKVIEAQSDGRGVTVTDLAGYFFRKGSRLRVLRHRYLVEKELQKVVDFCQSKADAGCPYDNWGVSFYALAALIPPMLSGWLEHPFAERFFNVRDAYFCSELVAEAFLECGHDVFGRRPWRVKPLDFAHTPLFEEVDCGFERWAVGGQGELVAAVA